MINTELVLPFAGLDLLPPGLSIDSVTGEINGTPAEVGTFDFTITVTDSYTPSNQASKAFNLEVVSPGPTDGYLIGHWTMNDNTQSTTVEDSSVYGNNGTAQRNTADMHITGVIDGVFTFDGSTDYVDLSGLGSTLKEVNISVSVWARYDSVTGPINWILGNAKQFRFGFGYEQVYFWIQEEELGSTNLISGGSVSAGNWYHIVGTYDGTYQQLYVNSLLVASEAPGPGVFR